MCVWFSKKTLQVLQGSAINKILNISQCTLPPRPVYQTLLSDFLRVWLRDYDLQYYISLISRPFSPPVFDHLQWAKMEGKGLGDLVTCMMSSRLRVDVRGRAVDDCCNSQTLNGSTSSLPNDELCWCCLSKASLMFLDMILQEGPWDSLSATPYLSLCHIVRLTHKVERGSKINASQWFVVYENFVFFCSIVPNPPTLTVTPMYDSSGGLLEIDSQAIEGVGCTMVVMIGPISFGTHAEVYKCMVWR